MVQAMRGEAAGPVDSQPSHDGHIGTCSVIFLFVAFFGATPAPITRIYARDGSCCHVPGRRAFGRGEGCPGPPGNTGSCLTGSGIRAGIYVLKLRIHPAFPVLFLRAHHGPHLGELIGIRHVRRAARLVVGVSRRRYAVSHAQILLQRPRPDQTRSALHLQE